MLRWWTQGMQDLALREQHVPPPAANLITQRMRNVNGERGRRTDMLRRLRAGIVAGVGRLTGRSRHDVEVLVAAEDYALPLRARGQSDVGNRDLECGLVGVSDALFWHHKILAKDVEPAVAARNRLLGDAHVVEVRI
jgi:hypothetical protein